MTVKTSKTPQLLLIRGLPGSGKSTMARSMVDRVHLEADMFFVVDRVYTHDASKIVEAHDWCRLKMREALAAGTNVVISNTCSRYRAMHQYLAIAREMRVPVTVIEATGTWPSIHGVPEDRIAHMRERWEKVPSSFPA